MPGTTSLTASRRTCAIAASAALIAGFLGLVVPVAPASAVEPCDNIVVSRVGDGAAALTSAGTAVFLPAVRHHHLGDAGGLVRLHRRAEPHRHLRRRAPEGRHRGLGPGRRPHLLDGVARQLLGRQQPAQPPAALRHRRHRHGLGAGQYGLADGTRLNGLGELPATDVGDSFGGDVTGIMFYDFGNYVLLPSAALPPLVDGGLQREVTPLTGGRPGQLTVGTFNVENLDVLEPQEKFEALAALPDGPTYQFRQIDPVNNADGGAPNGNIRQGFLFRTDRGVAFVDRPGATATTPNAVQTVGGDPQLQFSPSRIDPTNPAFDSSRKPLAGEFTFAGRTVFVVGNHWNSKGGDDADFGRFQPPVLNSEIQRQQQANAVTAFVEQIQAVDADANIIVAGDLNDFQFSAPVTTLTDAGYTSLVTTLPVGERYGYFFDGNGQVLDHIVVSNNLVPIAEYDTVHINAEFEVQQSDHDPSVARFRFRLTGPSRPGVVKMKTQWSLGESLTTGTPTTDFSLGTQPLAPIMGDWDGNGTRTPGFYKAGVFSLYNTVPPAPTPDLTFTFGDRRGFPIAGDFDGDGVDDMAVYERGTWQIRLTGTGATSTVTDFGRGSWPDTVPVAGDWDGDGTDGIGFFRNGTWTLRRPERARPGG